MNEKRVAIHAGMNEQDGALNEINKDINENVMKHFIIIGIHSMSMS